MEPAHQHWVDSWTKEDIRVINAKVCRDLPTVEEVIRKLQEPYKHVPGTSFPDEIYGHPNYIWKDRDY